MIEVLLVSTLGGGAIPCSVLDLLGLYGPKCWIVWFLTVMDTSLGMKTDFYLVPVEAALAVMTTGA
jgi:hypothetical protein